MDVRRKCLGVALQMVGSRNVGDVVGVLRKALGRTVEMEAEKAPGTTEYRQLLIQSIHVCAIKFSEVAADVVHALMEFLGDTNNPAAVDVVAFVRCVHFIFFSYSISLFPTFSFAQFVHWEGLN